MKWSWKIGKICGIQVYVHGTFLILLFFIGLSHLTEGKGVVAALGGVGFILALFGIIVLHELGHALTARRFGIRTKDITLLPIGGIARLERMPEDPRQELLVALAGPAVNIVLAAALFVVLVLGAEFVPLTHLTLVGGKLLAKLLWVNVGLAIFNLLPAFPMDGGRVLRAALAMRMDYLRATQIAASIGQAMAMMFALIGLFSNPFLLFIALFVWLGAQQEASMAQMRSALSGIPISRAMITDFQTLSPRDPLKVAVSHVLRGFQHDFPVVDDDRVVGVMTHTDLLTALSQNGDQVLVGDAMQRQFETADAYDMLETALGRLQSGSCYSIPVLRDGRLVGILTMSNVGEFVTIQSALHQPHPGAPGRAI